MLYVLQHSICLSKKTLHLFDQLKKTLHLFDQLKNTTSLWSTEKHYISLINWKNTTSLCSTEKHYISLINWKKHYISLIDWKKHYISLINWKKHYISLIDWKNTTSLWSTEKHYISLIDWKKHYISLIDWKNTTSLWSTEKHYISTEMFKNSLNIISSSGVILNTTSLESVQTEWKLVIGRNWGCGNEIPQEIAQIEYLLLSMIKMFSLMRIINMYISITLYRSWKWRCHLNKRKLVCWKTSIYRKSTSMVSTRKRLRISSAFINKR